MLVVLYILHFCNGPDAVSLLRRKEGQKVDIIGRLLGVCITHAIHKHLYGGARCTSMCALGGLSLTRGLGSVEYRLGFTATRRAIYIYCWNNGFLYRLGEISEGKEKSIRLPRPRFTTDGSTFHCDRWDFTTGNGPEVRIMREWCLLGLACTASRFRRPPFQQRHLHTSGT